MNQLSPGELKAARALVACVAALGVIGAVLSFAKVQAAVEPSFGELAPLVPLGVDVGIAAFTGLDLLMTRLDMRTRWLRLVPWALVGVTVYLNVSGETDLVGQVAHGAMPLLWVVAVEAGAHVLRAWAGLNRKLGERMDRIRSSRWLLAPLSTIRLWRDMVLWEIRSYPEALKRLKDQMLALGDLQDRYGSLRKAPRRERILYKLGRHTPADYQPDIAEPDLEPVEPSPNGDGIEHAAALLAQTLKTQGQRVTGRALREGLRAEQWKLSNERGNDLARKLQ